MTQVFKFRHPVLIGCVVIAGVLACLYSVSLGHNFLFDEESIVLENPLLRDPGQWSKLFHHGYFYREDVSEGLWTQYYRPLTSATFLFDYTLWKLNPLGYNLTNLGLFIALCLLLYRLVLRMTKNEAASFFATLLFSVHTIHTESVTYIASRGDLLGSLFLVGGLFLYWESRHVAALVFYALSLFCKESMLLLPVYFVLLELAFFKRPWRSQVARILPYVLVAAAFLIYRKYYCPVPMGPSRVDLQASALRFLSMGFPLLRYFEALIAPSAFRFCDEIVFAKSFADSRVFFTVGIFSLLLAAWAASFRRRGAVFFGLSLFGLSLAPYLQIIHFYPQWAEHYFLTPFIGLTILLAVAFSRVLATGRRALIAGIVVIYAFFFMLFAVRTVQRNAAYNDTIRYYELLAESPTPYAYYGYMNLGRILWKHGEYEKGGVFFKTALAIEKDSEANWNNMGAYWLQKKDYAQAYQCFKKAYNLNTLDSSSLQNAAVALLQMKRYKDSMAAFEVVQRKRPKSLGIYTNLMLNSELIGRPAKAVRWGHRGLAGLRGRDAESALLLIMLGNVAYREGWDSLARHCARRIDRDFPAVPLFGETGQLLAGRISGEEYLRLVQDKYAGFKDEAFSYVVMSFVLKKDVTAVERFLREKREDLARSGKDSALIAREIRRAEDLVKG